MKRTLLTLLTLLPLLGFSQTIENTQKAKTNAKIYLLKRLNNPASYRSASWGKLIKTYSTFEDSNEVKILDDSLEYYNTGRRNISNEIHSIKMKSILNYSKDSTYITYSGLLKQVDSAINSLNIKRVDGEKRFKPVFDGYIIDHSFRPKNKFNAYVLNNYYFVLNKSFKVIEAKDEDELERARKSLQDEIDALTGNNN